MMMAMMASWRGAGLTMTTMTAPAADRDLAQHLHPEDSSAKA